jgi:uncharacterized protein (UPF0261 family)
MAMNKTILGPLIKSKVDAIVDKTDRDALYEAIAAAVIEHIQAAATVTGLVVVGTSATGGPVTGTASGAAGSIV